MSTADAVSTADTVSTAYAVSVMGMADAVRAGAGL